MFDLCVYIRKHFRLKRFHISKDFSHITHLHLIAFQHTTNIDNVCWAFDNIPICRIIIHCFLCLFSFWIGMSERIKEWNLIFPSNIKDVLVAKAKSRGIQPKHFCCHHPCDEIVMKLTWKHFTVFLQHSSSHFYHSFKHSITMRHQKYENFYS